MARRAGGRRLRFRLGPDVADVRGETAAQEAAHDAHAHGARADHACRL